MNSQYKLIWFQHFHKAGGSSVINLAKQNGEIFFPYHQNGNPTNMQGKLLEIWNYSDNQLVEFLDYCEQLNVTFLATEWGVPNINLLSKDERVILVTCIREPLNRFISNYYYDLYNGFTPARTLSSYVNSRRRTITMPNYYCRMLSGINNKSKIIDDFTFETSLKILSKFDMCLILEQGFDQLNLKLDYWQVYNHKENKTQLGIRELLSLLRQGKLDLCFRRFLYPRKNPDSAFVESWKLDNSYDLLLYRTALSESTL